MTTYAVRVEGLHKRFGAQEALAGIDLEVPPGTVLGLLGPNGAGKTTAVRVLATLLRPDAGHAEVAGVDVVRRPAEVRRHIGLVGQHAALDEILSGRQNLVLFGRLHHLGASRARARATELLEAFDLTEAGDRPVSQYSGGMRRRLDLAAGLVLSPSVLFLDEPTAGLDPRGRAEVWRAVRALVRQGTTVLLTTQYLEEADQLAGRIALIDHGRVIAAGAPDELKAGLGHDRVEVVVRRADQLDAATRIIGGEQDPDTRRVLRPVAGPGGFVEVVRALDAAHIEVEDLALRRPSLDEVFLNLTGRVTTP